VKIICAIVGLLLLCGCSITWKGLPLLGVNPNGRLLYEHPELLSTNGAAVVPHNGIAH
jgi:hypothetical protein